MNIHNTYTKTLTALNEKTIEYKIISEKFENKTCYGIQVSEKSEKFSNSESIKNISDSFKLVKKIQKYVEFLKTNEEFETEFFEIGDRISISRKKSVKN